MQQAGSYQTLYKTRVQYYHLVKHYVVEIIILF